MSFNRNKAEEVAKNVCENEDEISLIPSFVEVCSFLHDFPSGLSWRGNKPDIDTDEGLKTLADKYFGGYRRSDFPVKPSTIPDEMVSVIMEKAYGYTSTQCDQIKLEHQHAMCSENCVGNLLERYLDSKLRSTNWSWCCGEFVKAIDFIRKNDDGKWVTLQIKNRNNSENSSSKAIREGTDILKWFRSFSKDTIKGRPSLTNWDNLPSHMQGYDLSEEEFKSYVIKYITTEQAKK